MVRITQATEHDFPHVRSLFLEYVQWLILMVETIWEYPVAITPVELVERDMAEVQKFMPPDGRLLLASDDSGVVGCASARTIHLGLAEIKRVYVRPSRRGSGTGRALIQTMIADLRDAGYTTMRLVLQRDFMVSFLSDTLTEGVNEPIGTDDRARARPDTARSGRHPGRTAHLSRDFQSAVLSS